MQSRQLGKILASGAMPIMAACSESAPPTAPNADSAAAAVVVQRADGPHLLGLPW